MKQDDQYEQRFNEMEQYIQKLQKQLKTVTNQLQYCLANLARLGIPIDEDSLQEFAEKDRSYW